MEPLYNVACSIRAFALVQKRYPGARLILSHDGPLRQELERLAAVLGLNHVEFIGRVSQEKSPELYASVDIYFTSPNIDNMPLSLLECFAAGVPVVATRVGGIPYILDHERTGLLVERNDHEAMAAAAIRLIEEEGLATRLTEAARVECQKYLWPALRGQWVSLYRELAKQP